MKKRVVIPLDERMNDGVIPEQCFDCNTLSLDQMVEYLDNKYKYLSTLDAKCIDELIRFYKKNKKK